MRVTTIERSLEKLWSSVTRVEFSKTEDVRSKRCQALRNDGFIDGSNGVEDVVEPLLIVTSHKEEASEKTSSRTK